jgi:hypothetical protein
LAMAAIATMGCLPSASATMVRSCPRASVNCGARRRCALNRPGQAAPAVCRIRVRLASCPAGCTRRARPMLAQGARLEGGGCFRSLARQSAHTSMSRCRP